ncbi:hypothetical protein K505DRAFT_321902 [Melanomma pulvis-pyrius CBS 109.77]|uniref:Uncharacterized protein n=1 Tax=Melanomma pulvis-pyrius CBS 109.77 TaxID=1314802 RepID=A0A6A6XQD9_9PLEO|nr:hypothetical protein K505DRAFT_321902 [Melanomma pulvis-pyrius CBS 109.77]
MKQVGPRPLSIVGHNVYGENPPSKPPNAPSVPLDHNVVDAHIQSDHDAQIQSDHVTQIQSKHAAQAHNTLSALTRSRAVLRHRELCLLHSGLDLSAAVTHAHRELNIGACAPFPPSPLLARLRTVVVNAKSKVKRNRLGRLEAKFSKAVQRLKAACAEREKVDSKIKGLAARMENLLTDGEIQVVEGCLLEKEFEFVEMGVHAPYSRLGLTAQGGWLES